MTDKTLTREQIEAARMNGRENIPRAEFEALCDMAEAYRRSLDQAGTVRVPVEPTEAMLWAAANISLPSYEGQIDHNMAYDIVSEEDIAAVYKAMLAAAKEQP